jgi:hypothetical protein
MKVTGPPAGPAGSSGPGGADPTGEASRTDAPAQTGQAEAAEGTGRAFADALAGAQARAPEAAQGAGGVSMTELAAEIDAGRLQPEAALEKVVDLVLAQQLGDGAPAAVREQVRAALREALESDPMLGEQLRRLTGGG